MKKEYSLALRIYHWLSALVVILIMLTVVFKNTLVSEVFFDLMLDSNLGYSASEIKEIIVVLNTEIWRYHIILGIILSVLFVFRIALFFTKSGYRVIEEAKLFISKKSRDNNEVKSLVYLIYYVVLSVVVFSGLFLAISNKSGFGENAYDFIAGLHEVFMNVIFMFVIIHIVGLIIGENENHKGIVSKMINGGEKSKLKE